MRIINILSLFLIFTTIITLSSCALTPDAVKSLDNTSKAYDKAIRWGNFDYARAMQVKPDNISDIERQRLKSIRVTSYKVISSNVSPDYTKAEFLVDIRYYSENSVVERVISDRQRWIYNEMNNSWKLETAFPAFKFH